MGCQKIVKNHLAHNGKVTHIAMNDIEIVLFSAEFKKGS
jgi:hypothetical protein